MAKIGWDQGPSDPPIQSLKENLTCRLQEKEEEIVGLKKSHKTTLESKDNEIKNLKPQITAYEERLETALCTAGQREKEKMHIVENHDNLKRMYTQLLSSVEEKEEGGTKVSKTRWKQKQAGDDEEKNNPKSFPF